jgi:SMC interacting uncharacterized protein involved in chromosome segregation
MQNQTEAKVKQSSNGAVQEINATEEMYSTKAAPAQVSPLAERLEKMREGVRNLKAQRDGLRAEIASMERDLEQVNDAVLRNEGALAMIQQLVQEEGR